MMSCFDTILPSLSLSLSGSGVKTHCAHPYWFIMSVFCLVVLSPTVTEKSQPLWDEVTSVSDSYSVFSRNVPKVCFSVCFKKKKKKTERKVGCLPELLTLLSELNLRTVPIFLCNHILSTIEAKHSRLNIQSQTGQSATIHLSVM